MNSVALVQTFDARHVLEQERNERNAVLPGELRVDLVELDDVVLAEVRRSFHPGEDDLDVSRLRTFDDGAQVFLQFSSLQTSQAFVASQRDLHHAHISLERPVETTESTGRR